MPKLKPSDLEIQDRNTKSVILYCQERKGITDDDIAKRLGCSKRTVQRKKQYPHLLTIVDLRVLAKVLDMTTEQKAELIGL